MVKMSEDRRLTLRIGWWLFSVPIYFKILGIGFLVACIFGSVTFFQVRTDMFQTYYRIHGKTAISEALSLAARIEDTTDIEDLNAIDLAFADTMEAFPSTRYIMLQNSDGKILSHGLSFPNYAPSEVILKNQGICTPCHESKLNTDGPIALIEILPRMALPTESLRAYSKPGEIIHEVTVPVSGERGETIRLGFGDKEISHETGHVSRSLFWGLALCMFIGQSLALALAYVLVRPIHNLVDATNRVKEGDFASRANVFSGDEVGELAESFNQMANALETYREEVQEKEADRVSLMGRIVEAQEEERKGLARELHDQLGQTLSSTLLTIAAHCKNCQHHTDACEVIGNEVREAIEEVRRLAWDMRPSVLDDYGLDIALKDYVNDMSKRIGIPIDLQCVLPDDSSRLPSHIEVPLFRITQEAVNNISRHAGANQASVVLLHKETEVILMIEDDGRGFDLNSVRKRGDRPSLGIMGMRERTSLLGGDFVVDTSPGKSTIIRVRIPLNSSDQQQEFEEDAHSSPTGG
ncbi:HAMP domain-containing protein [Candidatus Hydrogenedentota bacterium]